MGNLKVPVFPVQTGFSRSTSGGRVLKGVTIEFLDLENINIGKVIKFHKGERWVTLKFQNFRFELDFRGKPVVV